MKVLVISAHPDDEVLGCGGSLLKHQKEGHELHWLIATTMLGNPLYNEATIEKRKQEIKQVEAFFGFQSVHELPFASSSLSDESLPSLIKTMAELFSNIRPERVYVMNRSDAHSDHRIVFEACMACCKSFRYPFVKQVLMYECLSETEFAPALSERSFLPNYFIDISDFLEAKLQAMEIYASELGEHPFPRSKKNMAALATLRGATAAVYYAEAFQLIKYIEN